MKTRNQRRRQWERYVDQLDRLRRRLPDRTAARQADIWASPDAIITAPVAYQRRARRDARRWSKRARHRWQRTARWVEHDCVWEPTELRINAAGDTQPGFVCVYELGNGTGRCESNVFDLADAYGKAACLVRKGGPGW